MQPDKFFSSQEPFDKAIWASASGSSQPLYHVALLEKECGSLHPFMLLDHTDNVTEKAPFILLIRKNTREKSVLASSQRGILNNTTSFKPHQGMQIHAQGIIRTLQLAEIPAPPGIQDSVALITSTFTFPDPW